MTTPEQLAQWACEFKAGLKQWEIHLINGEMSPEMRLQLQGYLRAKQETEQAMKLAKFGAEVANHVDGMGAVSSVAIWRIAARVGVLTEDKTEYASNIGETIERLLK